MNVPVNFPVDWADLNAKIHKIGSLRRNFLSKTARIC